jgi:hypothetical protein
VRVHYAACPTRSTAHSSKEPPAFAAEVLSPSTLAAGHLDGAVAPPRPLIRSRLPNAASMPPARRSLVAETMTGADGNVVHALTAEHLDALSV